MIRALLIASVLPISVVFAQTVAGPQPRAVCCPHELGFDDDAGCGKARALRLRVQEDEDPVIRWQLREALTDTDVIHNNLDFEIVPSTENITGVNTMTVRSLRNGLTEFTFMLRSNYTISQCQLNGSVNLTPTSVGSYGRRVTLDRPYNTGEQFTLRVAYTGTAVSRGFGSIEFQTQPSSSNPIVASLSEAYFAATWWPCKDGDFGLAGDNADKSTLQIAITAPNTLRSVSNGLLVGIDELSGNRRRYRWTHNYPISTYLVAFASSVYNTWTVNYQYPLPGGGTGVMPVEFNIYPGSDTPANRASWEKVLDMLPTFRGVFGEYPFINEKYGIYQFPFGGGMEHQTNSGQGTFSESVTAHELAHQWWGDHVTCRTWGDIWLNEGFATYSEALWLEFKPGSTGTPALHAAMAARRPSAVNDSVYVTNVADMNRIFSGTYSYRKGGWVLHMLRHVVGDSTFFNILSQYRAQYGGSAATTDDFAAVASQVSGINLGNFFTQWVYQAGAPAYRYGFRTDVVNGKRYLRMHLSQTQDASWGINSAFQMPVDIRISGSFPDVSRTLSNTSRIQHYVIPLPPGGDATGLAVDEFDWILATNKTTETYIQGPPVVVEASPAPGASIQPAATPVIVYFSDNVSNAAMTVSGPAGSVNGSVVYSGPDKRATFTPAAQLAPGQYTVTIPATVTAAGGALDGEVANPASAASLPSGNGVAGGNAVFTFTVLGCAADLNGDGSVDFNDYLEFLNLYNANDLRADFNADGIVDFNDYLEFLNRYNSGC